MKTRCATFAVMICAFLFSEAGAAPPVQVEQYFPAAPPSMPRPKPESGWRISYQVLEPKTHGYGPATVWQIDSIEFMRGYRSDGAKDWIRLMDNLVLSEIYVPYNDGKYILDISGRTRWGFPPPLAYDFVQAQKEYLPVTGAFSAAIQSDGYVIAEVVDDGLRFMDNRDKNKVRRGQILWLWATLSAANYRYVIKYGFADDGTISVRIGGTAENLYDDEHIPTNKAIHVHMACWRMQFDLGNGEKNMIHVVERQTKPDEDIATVWVRPFNSNREGGERWTPENFTALKVMNPSMNYHQPPRSIGYKLLPARSGSVRTRRAYTHYDFWVTRAEPDDSRRRASAPELRCIDVPDKIKVPEPIENRRVVVWYSSAIHHMPRTEDFGAKDYNSKDGVAVAMWTGFDLMPHDFWHKTPLLNR